MEFKILKKEIMYCPICGEEHEVELRESDNILKIKDEDIKYKEKYYYCNNVKENNCFTKNNMMFENILCAKDNYRKSHGLLTSSEIKNLRNKFNLSQAEFSFILGLGEITITRYETKQIQDVSIDQILRYVKNNPMILLEYLEKRKNRFSENRYNEIKENIKNVAVNNINNIKMETLKCEYLNYDIKNELNGNCILDIEKLNNIVAYITSEMNKSVGNLKKVILMKLLWYIDAKSYKENNKAITGLVYVHENFGALPIGHEEILYLPSIKFKIEQLNEEQYQYNISLKESYKIKKIDDREKKIIDEVIDKFKNFKSSEIAKYMHKEDAYKKTLLAQPIPFTLTITLKEF
jgi:putative zinc finger/helix-turn-helix YgiT family protein